MDNNKVLLICSDFRCYARSYKRAFENNGYEVRLVQYRTSLDKRQVIRRALVFIGFASVSKRDYVRKRDKLNQEVLAVFRDYKPSIVCLVLCKDLDRSTLIELKKASRVIQILGDTMGLYEDLGKNLDLFDLVYSYELRDVEYIRNIGINAFLLKSAFDGEDYYPVKCDKAIDVAFVGKMYSNRQEILRQLAIDLPNINCKFYGEYAPLRKPWQYVRWLINKIYKSTFVNRNTQITETNKIYNQAKIVLNIHCSQTTLGWSSRLPEISATGAFQIVDFNPVIADEFGSDIVMYKNYDELLTQIQYYLLNTDEREAKARRGFEHVQTMTITKSVENMMKDLKNIGACED